MRQTSTSILCVFGSVWFGLVRFGAVWSGPLEEMLVDRIVTAHWPSRRALKAEAGEIALNVDDGNWQRAHRDLTLPLTNWSLVSTNLLNADGSFSNPIPLTPEPPPIFLSIAASIKK